MILLRLRMGPPIRLLAVAALATILGCGRANSSGPNQQRLIKHIVIIIQENRSFDNLFQGFPGADSSDSGLIHTGQKVSLEPVPLEVDYDLSHGYQNFLQDYDSGKMDGFDLEHFGSGFLDRTPIVRTRYPAYSYVPKGETKPYWWLAQNYVLYDRMFQSNLDQSFAAHLYLVGAQAAHTANVPNGRPWGCDAPKGTTVATLTDQRKEGERVFPCFGFRTLADELDAKALKWRYYAPAIDTREDWFVYAKAKHEHRLRIGQKKPEFGQLWSAFDAIAQVRYGDDWYLNVVSPETQVLSDIKRGSLANVTWIVPDLRNSDHSSSRSNSGPDWVASIVNEIGESRFWRDSAIFIVWDDSGGWYDHVPPPQLDYDGLGDRVPLIVVSAYARKNYVSHSLAEFGSILKFAERTFFLPTLSASDARANDLFDGFDFAQPERTFDDVPTHLTRRDFLHEPPSRVAPDDD